jgi:hypothetical protein
MSEKNTYCLPCDFLRVRFQDGDPYNGDYYFSCRKYRKKLKIYEAGKSEDNDVLKCKECIGQGE